MARPVSVDGGRHAVVCVRLSTREVAALDAHRGSASRGTYLRGLLKAAVSPPASRALQSLNDE